MRTLAALVLVSIAVAGCPREEAIDHVGGAAGRQMDDVRKKMDKVEDKLEGKANEAAKGYE